MGTSNSKKIDKSNNSTINSSFKDSNIDEEAAPTNKSPNIYNNSGDNNKIRQINITKNIEESSYNILANSQVNNNNGNNIRPLTDNGNNLDQNIGGNHTNNEQKTFTNKPINQDMNIGKNQTNFEEDTKENLTNKSTNQYVNIQTQTKFGEDVKKEDLTYINKPTNKPVNISLHQTNFGEDVKQDLTNNINTPNNKDSNIGPNQTNIREDTKEDKTNIDINIHQNQVNYQKKTDDPSTTNTGNVDINIGGNNKITENGSQQDNDINKDNNNNEEDDKKIYTNKSDNEIMRENVRTCNYSDLNISDPNDINILKINSFKKVNEGLFPLFLKINDSKPHFFYVKEDSTLNILLDYYYYLTKTNNNGKNINLYKGETLLDKNTQIKDLNIRQFELITGH